MCCLLKGLSSFDKIFKYNLKKWQAKVLYKDLHVYVSKLEK